MANEDLILADKLSNISEEEITKTLIEKCIMQEYSELENTELTPPGAKQRTYVRDFSPSQKAPKPQPAQPAKTKLKEPEKPLEDSAETEYNFTEKELRHLSKRELFSIIYELKLREENLLAQVADCEEKLNDKTIEIENAGSIAEAALSLNNVFGIAQKAADEYLASVRKSCETSEKNIEKARAEAKTILNDAKLKAKTEEDTAKKNCDRLLAQTNAKCAKLELETKEKCTNLERLSEQKCSKLELETKEKCSGLESEANTKCTRMLAENEAEINRRWTAFQSNVSRILEAHRELKSMFT